MKTVALNKIIAVEKGAKTASNRKLTDVYHKLQKPALLSGISRTYRPKDDDGDQLPPEQTRVQLRAQEAIDDAMEAMTQIFDVVATKDWGNTQAKADIVVDDQAILKGVPVTYLLFMEKQLTDLKTFIQKLPLLDQSEVWRWDENQNCYATEPVETHRTKKLPRVLTKAEATEHHPAQTEVWHEDVVVGYWQTLKYSGALPATRSRELLRRVEKLQQAVKFAREQANATEVEQVKVGKTVLDWVFA